MNEPAGHHSQGELPDFSPSRDLRADGAQRLRHARARDVGRRASTCRRSVKCVGTKGREKRRVETVWALVAAWEARGGGSRRRRVRARRPSRYGVRRELVVAAAGVELAGSRQLDDHRRGRSHAVEGIHHYRKKRHHNEKQAVARRGERERELGQGQAAPDGLVPDVSASQPR